MEEKTCGMLFQIEKRTNEGEDYFYKSKGIQFCNLTEDRMEKLFSYKIPYEDIASVRTYVPMTRLVQIQLKSGEIKIFAVNKRKIWAL